MIYEFDQKTDETFEKTVESIAKLNYSRYKPLAYVKMEKFIYHFYWI